MPKTLMVEFTTIDECLDVEQVKMMVCYVFRAVRVKVVEVKQQ